jgi:regulator of extracellular matrix RemA (YlzA/DUF370 family)
MIGVVVRRERVVAVEEAPEAPVPAILSSAIRGTNLHIDAGRMRRVRGGARA